MLQTYLVSRPLSSCNETLLNFNRDANLASLRNGVSWSQYCAYDPYAERDACQGMKMKLNKRNFQKLKRINFFRRFWRTLTNTGKTAINAGWYYFIRNQLRNSTAKCLYTRCILLRLDRIVCLAGPTFLVLFHIHFFCKSTIYQNSHSPAIVEINLRI